MENGSSMESLIRSMRQSQDSITCTCHMTTCCGGNTALALTVYRIVHYYKNTEFFSRADQNFTRCYKWSRITVASDPPLEKHF